MRTYSIGSYLDPYDNKTYVAIRQKNHPTQNEFDWLYLSPWEFAQVFRVMQKFMVEDGLRELDMSPPPEPAPMAEPLADDPEWLDEGEVPF